MTPIEIIIYTILIMLLFWLHKVLNAIGRKIEEIDLLLSEVSNKEVSEENALLKAQKKDELNQ